ncbi:hypothetical protein PR048_025346 [Dryococelus australis]|uniref:Tyrosine-protein phosphatase domain-containing protein n=1 Tax=Dryococelus australis TaxID=614101 RepID=A0ABQ9GR17_9NEOP|nr:hypothetical protein PR048_025346 [Dryococelus australis]
MLTKTKDNDQEKCLQYWCLCENEESEPGGSDYIHANYVSGFDNSRKFITTQEPMAQTFDEFWHMVFQENSYIIVMLAGVKKNLKLNCIQCCSSDENRTSRQFKVTDIPTDTPSFLEFMITVTKVSMSFNISSDH